MIYADFEADNEKESFSVGNKTTNILKQNPVCNNYRIVSELENVSKGGYQKSPLGYGNVDWFVDEINKLENKMKFWFRKTEKDIIMTQEDNDAFENKNICRFCEKKIEAGQVKDHRHLTGRYRGPDHNTCNINVNQKDSIFIKVILHKFSIYDCHLFFKQLVDKTRDKVDYKVIPKTNEEYISIRYGCARFIDSYRILSSSLSKIFETLVDNS